MSGSIEKNKNDVKSSKDVDEREEGIGQGKLYSPDHAIRINTNQQNNIEHKSSNNNNNIATQKYHNNLGHQHNQEEIKRNNNHNNNMVGRGVAIDVKNKMAMVKERLMEKLAAASVPSDVLENARHFFESVIKDVTSAAHGLTKDALQRVKSHLAEILPSLSPSLTSKMVDDAAKESSSDNKETRDDVKEKGKAYVSPASSFFSNYLVRPVSKL